MSDIDLDRRRWVMKELFGMKTAPPEREFEVFTKAVLICAKGDGVLAPEERTWIAGLAACYSKPK